MSTFIVSDDCLNVVAMLVAAKRSDYPVCEDCDKAARELLALNYRAYHRRYAHRDDIGNLADDLAYVATYKHTTRGCITGMTDVQRVKYCQAYAYQCCEGDEFTETELYKLVEDVIRELCSKIVSELPEYSKAKWG